MSKKSKQEAKLEFLKPFKLVSTLSRKKEDPNNFIFTGDTKTERIDIQLYEYKKELCIENNNILYNNIKSFELNESNYWLNVYGLNETEIIASICKKQGIHDLIIQDILDVNQRPKFQEDDGYSFLTLKSIISSENNLITEQISFVFGSNFLISFQERKADIFEHLILRLRENIGLLRERSVDYLLFSMLESILDNYFKTLNKIEQEIEKFSFTDLNKELSPNVMEVIENHKKFVQFIKKSILPIKEFSQFVEREECQCIDKKHIKYFLEIKDLCFTLIDNCDMILATLESSTNLYFFMQGHRMNQVMKTLTMVATIFIPLTFIAGIYGMNFRYMPELEWSYGYLVIWIVIILISLGMIFYFRKKKWL